jgi:hypothetical protein
MTLFPEKKKKRPLEIITVNVNELIILPFKVMRRKNVPFRYNGRWWRRSTTNKWGAVEVKIEIEDGVCAVQDLKEFKREYVSPREGALIATFKGLLNQQELRCKRGKVTVKN